MGTLKRALADRIGGERASVGRAVIAAVVAGAMAAGITYRVLRS